MVELRFDGEEFGRLASMFGRADPLFRQALKAALRRAGSGMRSGIGKGVRQKSYLRGKVVSRAIRPLVVTDDEASVLVNARNQVAYKFRLSPNRVTARKGLRSVNWQSPNVLKGPGLAPLNPHPAGFSRPFIANIRGKKAMYVRERHSGLITMPRIASPQYFAAFKAVKGPVLQSASETFRKRLEHEIDYRLGLLR